MGAQRKAKSSFTIYIVSPPVKFAPRRVDRFEAIERGVQVFDEPIDVPAVPAALRPLAGFDALQELGFRLVHIRGRETQLHAARPVRQGRRSLSHLSAAVRPLASRLASLCEDCL